MCTSIGHLVNRKQNNWKTLNRGKQNPETGALSKINPAIQLAEAFGMPCFASKPSGHHDVQVMKRKRNLLKIVGHGEKSESF
jgi:hypothetical protein